MPENLHIPHLSSGLSVILMCTSIVVALLGIALAYTFYISKRDLPEKTAKAFAPIYKLFYNKWYFDEIYGRLIVEPLVYMSKGIWHCFDMGVIDFTVNAFGKSTVFCGGILKFLQTGRIQTYIFTMILGSLILIIIFYTI
jgi:NADH-quinone oxidoreductase subunit L